MVSAPFPPRVLITEDEPAVSKLLARLLARAGFDTVETADANTAVIAIRSGHFDLMLLDMNLPDMSGMETLEIVKQEQPNLPVIVVTGSGTIPSAVEAIQGGAYDYLTKPLRGDDLIRLARRVVSEQAIPECVGSDLPPAVKTHALLVSSSVIQPHSSRWPLQAGKFLHCPRCSREPLRRSRVLWHEYALLLAPWRPYRCLCCYQRFWRVPRRERSGGINRSDAAINA